VLDVPYQSLILSFMLHRYNPIKTFFIVSAMLSLPAQLSSLCTSNRESLRVVCNH
jgi:hypothetical protein